MVTYSAIETPVGLCYFAEENGSLTHSGFDVCPGERGETPLLKEAKAQFKAYFEGTLQSFHLPLNPRGTDFQKAVWAALTAIPYGRTTTYGAIAAAVGNPKACRAVGGANNKNPLGIIVPCHRVIGADKSLVGYAGGLGIKKWLLEHEAKFCGQK